MNLQKLSLDQFKEKVSGKLDGVYVFITSDCPLCQYLLKNFQKFNIIDNVYVVDCINDVNYFMKEFDLDDMPTTIIFKDNIIKYEVMGVLFEKQMRELKKENDSLSNSN
jgi:hypothetical protein